MQQRTIKFILIHTCCKWGLFFGSPTTITIQFSHRFFTGKNPNPQNSQSFFSSMADVKAVEEGTAFPEKRKPEAPISIAKPPAEEKIEDGDKADSNKKQKLYHQEEEEESNGKSVIIEAVEQQEPDDDDDDDDEEEDYAGEEEEVVVVVDRKGKGKGIMVDNKGKGKMYEDDSDDNDDNDDDDESSDDSDSDFSDGLDDSELEEDPLAEVDLDNILPSRTRQSRSQPGLRISDGDHKDSNA